MTVAVNDTIERFAITSVGPYAYTWRIFNDTDLQVYALSPAIPPVPTLLTYLTHYTVAGANQSGGGSITLTAAAYPAFSGYTLDIRANTPEDQPTSIRNQARFLPEIHEDAFDYLSRQIQDLRRLLNASIRAPDNEPTLSMIIPPVASRAGKYEAYDGSGVPIASSGTGNDSALRTDLANGTSGADGSRLTNFRSTDVGSVARTLFQKFSELRSVMDFGCVADSATDNTATILAKCNALGGFFLIPPGVKYNRKTLLQTLATNVLLLDLSFINDFTDPGQTAKRLGIIARDTSANDSSWNVESGHHPGISVNNFGTAGTGSAALRVASFDWMCGAFANTGASLGGDRFAANTQYQKHPSGNFWAYFLSSFAPWLALADEYEYWKTLEVIAGAGKYRVQGSNVYVSTGAGTTGGSPPVHVTGTVSDGGVSWTFVDTVGRSVAVIDEYARVLFGTNSVGAQFEQQVTPTDPGGGDYNMALRPLGVSKKAIVKLFATTAGAAQSPQPFLQAQDGVGLRVMRSSGAGSVQRFTDIGQLIEDAVSAAVINVASGDTTPSMLGSLCFHLVNAGATNITALDDGVDGQEVELFASNGNTTFVSSATLLLQGSVNVTLTAWSSITFRKVPNSISNRWIERTRSIK